MEHLGHAEHAHDNSLGTRVGQFADRWWPVFLIAFGTVFLLGLPFHTPGSY